MIRSRSEVAVISRPPSLPSASSAVLLAADAAVRLGRTRLDRAMQRADHHIGEPRESFRRLLGRDRARQDARTDQEHLLLPEQAQPVEQVLVGAAPRPWCVRGRPPAPPRPAARRRSSDRAAHPSPPDSARECRPAAARCRASAPPARRDRGSAAAARTAAPPPCRPARKRSKPTSAASGFSARASRSSRIGTSSANWLARQLAAQRGIGAVRKPAAHGGRRLQRLAKAHRAQPVERFAMIRVLRKRQFAAPRARRRILEQLRVMAAAPCADARAAPRRRRRGSW